MTKYYIWLQLCLGAGSCKVPEVLNKFGNPINVYNANREQLVKSGVFSATEIKRMNNNSLLKAERIINECKANKIDIITLGSEKYPFCLSVIENPPLVLYVKGSFPDFDKIPSIAIVGPRKISEFGRRAAFSLSYRLSKAGITVVSGGAVGGDTCAHAGALKANGTTALVMPCGLLSDYPKENADLRRAVIQNGCIISEYPSNTSATRYCFPVRNRIISALSLGTVVIEAGEKSGALITARQAYEQGRDVFVIPHSIDDERYSGSNALLRDGAKPLLDASDIFNEYILRFPDKINIDRAYNDKILTDNKKENNKILKNLGETLSNEAKIVYNCLDKPKFLPEDINSPGLSSEQILSALTELEMEFYIKALPGGFYEKC